MTNTETLMAPPDHKSRILCALKDVAESTRYFRDLPPELATRLSKITDDIFSWMIEPPTTAAEEEAPVAATVDNDSHSKHPDIGTALAIKTIQEIVGGIADHGAPADFAPRTSFPAGSNHGRGGCVAFEGSRLGGNHNEC
jgi:hypothetical protein